MPSPEFCRTQSTSADTDLGVAMNLTKTGSETRTREREGRCRKGVKTNGSEIVEGNKVSFLIQQGLGLSGLLLTGLVFYICLQSNFNPVSLGNFCGKAIFYLLGNHETSTWHLHNAKERMSQNSHDARLPHQLSVHPSCSAGDWSADCRP